jgi:HEAT repeat protein
VRRAAVVAIVKLGTFPSTAFPPYVRRLGDPDSLVRELTISSITDLGRDAVPTLRRALEDSSAATRAGAARALGLLGKEGLSASNALKEASNDEEEMVAESARRALRTMGIEPPKQ